MMRTQTNTVNFDCLECGRQQQFACRVFLVETNEQGVIGTRPDAILNIDACPLAADVPTVDPARTEGLMACPFVKQFYGKQ